MNSYATGANRHAATACCQQLVDDSGRIVEPHPTGGLTSRTLVETGTVAA